MPGLFTYVDTVHRALDYHQRRHNVLSGNVANVDTPGFKPFELLRVPEGQATGSLALQTTRAGHLQPQGFVPTDEAVTVEDPLAPAGVDGNSVSLEREMSKLAANDLRYQTAAKIVRAKLAGLRYIATDGTGR